MVRSLPVVFLVTIMSVAQAQTPRYTPGEVMLRFAAESEGRAVVVRSMEADPADLSALAFVVTALGARSGVPLRATRLGSGHWLTVAIDSVALVDRVHAQLRARENIDDVTRRGEAPRLLVRLTAGSAEAAAASQAVGGAMGPLERVVSALEREVGVPLTTASIGRDTIAVDVDMQALTMAVVERMKALPEIEEAQPNYIMGFR